MGDAAAAAEAAANATSAALRATSTATNAVNAASVKLAPFWPKRPLLWFARAEAQFRLRNITAQQTRFDHVLQALDDEAVARVSDIVMANPLAHNCYDNLKARLTDAFDLSDEERARRLLDGPQLGDRKPSVLLAEINELFGQRNIDFLKKELILRALPANVAAICRASNAATLEELCTEADRHFAITGALMGAPVNAVDCSSEGASARLTSTDMEGDFDVHAVRTRFKGRPTPSATPNAPAPRGMCFYHEKFGAKAQKCRHPCSYAPPAPTTPPGFPPRRPRPGNGAAGDTR